MYKHKNSEPTLIGIGEILWDQLPTGRKLGGAPANFAYHVQALGSHATVVSAVGNDEAGNDILKAMEDIGINRKFVALDSQHPTGIVTVGIDSQGGPTYSIRENAAWDFIPFHPEMETLAGTAEVVCFGSLCQRSSESRTTIQKFLGATRKGCKRIFDINLRQSYYSRSVLKESLQLANILKINNDELHILAKMLDLRGIASSQITQLFRMFPLELIALTRGEQGAVVYTPSAISECGGFPVAVVDTVGAGDAYTAALALGLLAGASLDDINRRACFLAAFVCSQQGATPKLPTELASKLLYQ